MGKYSKDKGYRAEVAVVNLAKSFGLAAHRVPFSGAIMGYPDDVVLRYPDGDEERGEVKCRGDGFANLYHWLEDVALLFVKADRKPILVVLRAEDYFELRGGKKGAAQDEEVWP